MPFVVPFAGTIAEVPGIAVGHWTDRDAATGCTVVLCNAHPGDNGGDDSGAVGGVAVRGGSPGTRETDLLHPVRRVQRMHAVVLSGGSAFGLAAADGAQRWLEERGIGFPTAHARVPIVPAAILYDLGIGRAEVRPDAAAGYAAAGAAAMASSSATAQTPVAAPLAAGSVGAGAGATVGKMWGLAAAVKGGFGSARCILPGGAAVGAAVAVNAWGGIWDYRSGRLVAGPRQADGSMCDPMAALLSGSIGTMAPGTPQSDAPVGTAMNNTTIGIVATDAPLDKMQANFVAAAAHDGLALTIRPCHTPGDGDTMFCAATGRHPAPADLTVITTAAVAATAQAALHAIRSATGLAGVPAVGELGLNSDTDLEL